METMGHQLRFGLGALASTNATREFDVLSNGLKKTGSLVSNPGIRGTRSHMAAPVAEGTYAVGGPLVLEPRPDDLAFLLPYILGGAAVLNTYALAETVPELVANFTKGLNNLRHNGLKVNTAVFRSATNQPLQLTLDLQGKTEEAGIAMPAISATLSALQPYIHHQLVATLGSTAYDVDNVEITVNNALALDLFRNSQTRQELPEGDRIVTVACDFPHTADEAALYDIAVAGIAGTFVWTNGAFSLGFSFANLKAPTDAPVVQNRGPLGWRINFQAYATTPGNELVVTNDATA